MIILRKVRSVDTSKFLIHNPVVFSRPVWRAKGIESNFTEQEVNKLEPWNKLQLKRHVVDERRYVNQESIRGKYHDPFVCAYVREN
ncbi:hypothetical protein GWI33_016420 [Rhynchophorus ferrugineus]|uniref:Uncharacterized protein n=1 Tax=Rhynchophorus ferrugineus TaxID=354439 RepID=A0A834HYS5_RHYFE|nr:hypothetical protein GWI33_016420 [Rhynchophorus ferrugineus]